MRTYEDVDYEVPLSLIANASLGVLLAGVLLAVIIVVIIARNRRA